QGISTKTTENAISLRRCRKRAWASARSSTVPPMVPAIVRRNHSFALSGGASRYKRIATGTGDRPRLASPYVHNYTGWPTSHCEVPQMWFLGGTKNISFWPTSGQLRKDCWPAADSHDVNGPFRRDVNKIGA